MITIRFAMKNEAEKLQKILNDPSIISYLGGFTMLETIKKKISDKRPSFWVADFGSKSVGAFMIAGRPQSHMLKYGELGVLQNYRRNRIGSAMYLAATIQGILEGRRLFEDTIVGDNPTQFFVLPTLGLNKAGELRHRTASGKSICLFQLSLLDEGSLETMIRRVPETTRIQVLENSYTADLWEKNTTIYEKFNPDFIPILEGYREKIRSMKTVHITQGDT